MITEPTWLYKKVKLDSVLPIFQKELLALAYQIDPQLPTRENYLVSETNKDKIKQTCPYFYKYLTALKIERHLLRVGFVIVSKPKRIIHSDYPASSFALNLPILNCKDTYTVWYDSVITAQKATEYNSPTWVEVGDSPLYEESSAIEIGRIDSNQPHWVNVRVPHSPECNHNNLRINCTIRFYDNIYEYLIKQYGP